MIEVTHISKKFGSTSALEDVSFSLEEGRTLCIIGTSGSGKSTLLRLLNRMLTPAEGTITLRGRDIQNIPEIELRRKTGYVLQQPALFPHWTAEKNIGLVPRLLHWNEEKIKERTEALLQLMHLPPGIYKSRYPAELSGGEQQRVGIARALAAHPDLVLFDEPFSALDPVTRADLQNEVLRLKKNMRFTAVFVTHNIKEAFLLGDKITVLHQGKVLQTGSREDLLENPANRFVEEFIRADYEI